jgi:hypothetical protein
MNTTSLTLASIRNRAPLGTYHAKVHLTALGGGLKIIHLTEVDGTALKAVQIEDRFRGLTDYDLEPGVGWGRKAEALMASLVVERIDYLVSPTRLLAEVAA